MMSLVSSHLEAPTSLAIVAASNEPLLFLTQDLTIIAVSESFCRAFQIEPAGLAGRRLSDIGAGEWGNCTKFAEEPNLDEKFAAQVFSR